MEERTYTQKELYQFVTEYSREAREEGFDAMVGDFVDWIVSREEKDTVERSDSIDFIDPYKDYPEIFPRTSVPGKPVLPEKLEDPCYVQYGTESERDMLLLIVELIRKQNEIIDYLKEKDL